MVGVVDSAELSWCDTMDWFGECDVIKSVIADLYFGIGEYRCMPYLYTDLHWEVTRCQQMKVVDEEVVFVCRSRVVAFADVEDVSLQVFLNGKPRSFTKAKSFALTDGVEPQASMLTDTTSCFKLDYVTRILAEVAAYVVVVVYLAQEANTLRILAFGINEVLAFGNLTYLTLHHTSDGEDGFFELPRLYLT